jgi:hypothetical protein
MSVSVSLSHASVCLSHVSVCLLHVSVCLSVTCQCLSVTCQCLSVCLSHDTVYLSPFSGQQRASRLDKSVAEARWQQVICLLSTVNTECWRLFRRIQNGLCVALTTRTPHRPHHSAQMNYVKGKFDVFSSQVSA